MGKFRKDERIFPITRQAVSANIDRLIEPVGGGSRRSRLGAYVRQSAFFRGASSINARPIGFYPVTADIPKKRHTVPKECSCPDAENIAQSSNAMPSL
ncbi:hypothetical protein MARHY1992 [Marinobacter nauticus ATCC 49840]|nr:hypothetical protein MARHY1992 [Marinobacter nauticus ATCC 49840]